MQEIFSDQKCDVSDDGIISTLKNYLFERSDCQKKMTVSIYIFMITSRHIAPLCDGLSASVSVTSQ